MDSYFETRDEPSESFNNAIDDSFDKSEDNYKEFFKEYSDEKLVIIEAFRKEEWEKFEIFEKKAAIEDLAEMHNRILEIEDKPQVLYYECDDVGDFGYYKRSENAIYINECNINDNEETIDTISHEYRHVYQYERIMKLDNETDREYLKSMSNYIKPEDDYRGYKNQLVEVDAREYAEIYREMVKR